MENLPTLLGIGARFRVEGWRPQGLGRKIPLQLKVEVFLEPARKVEGGGGRG